MSTDGGAMYHYRGFAGLPESQQPWTGLILKPPNQCAIWGLRERRFGPPAQQL